MSQSPEAAAAPVLRARPIWLMGSKATSAPASRANSAVRSVELLSQTISSVSQLRRLNAPRFSRIVRSVCLINSSSLKAGTIIEILCTSHVLDDIVPELGTFNFGCAFHLAGKVVSNAFGGDG